MKFDERFKKVILNNGEKDYIFYVGAKIFDKTNELVILVDSNDNILNVWHGKYPKLYKNILFFQNDYSKGAYFNIETGEQLFKKFTENEDYRLFNGFSYGYARMFNDKKEIYEVINTKGEIIKSFDWFYMLNEKRGISHNSRYDTTFNNCNLLDENLNIIKEYCYSDAQSIEGDKYIIAKEGACERKSLYYMFDYDGNKVSKGYSVLKTNDFKTFKTRTRDIKKGYNMLTLDEILI